MLLDVHLDMVLETYSKLEDRTSSTRDSSMSKEPNISKKWNVISEISLRSKWQRCVNCWSIACKEFDENCPGPNLRFQGEGSFVRERSRKKILSDDRHVE